MIELLGDPKQAGPLDDIDFRTYTWRALAGGGHNGIFHHAADVYEGKMYISGGATNGLPSTSFYEYDPDANVLTSMGAFPLALCGHIAKVIGDYLYVLCGMIDNNKTYINQVRRFDLVNQVWELRTPCPVTLCWGDGCVIGTDIYMVGGSSAAATVEVPPEMFLYKYDTIADTWTKITLTGISPRLSNGVCVLDGSIYILGGRYNRVYLADFWKYTPATSELVRLADHPAPHGARFQLHGVMKKVVNLAGQLVSDSPYRNTYQYYVEEDRWELAKANGVFAFSVTSWIDNRFIVIGGRQSTGNMSFAL